MNSMIKRNPFSNKLQIPKSRVELLASALGHSVFGMDDAATALPHLVNPENLNEIWLAIAILAGTYPTAKQVLEVYRQLEFDPSVLYRQIMELATADSLNRPIKLVTDKVLIDVTHTASVTFTSGIQRVVRECVQQWENKPDVLFVSWFSSNPEIGYDALRTLTPTETARLPHGLDDYTVTDAEFTAEVVIPVNCRYFIPELAADESRPPRIQALAEFTSNAVGVIGHDLIPLTSGETTLTPWVPGNFAILMSALRYAKLIVTTSKMGSEIEYAGWKQMLAAIGIEGPVIETVPLTVSTKPVSETSLANIRKLLTIPGLPTVLVVGSREPRKNHLAVLFAAEVLWREGLQFNLVFIGGNSWNSTEFENYAAKLAGENYPITIIRKASDDLLWSAYRLADFSIFPSLNEGFGLPVGESLAVGTPVITSNFGSMAEIAAGGGALVIDPRDDNSLIEAMRLLLTDRDLLSELSQAAAARHWPSWAQYADQVWEKIMQMPIPAIAL